MTTPLDITDFVYRTGTLTIALGETTAVFAGTGLTNIVKDGDWLFAGGVLAPIETVTDNTTLELFTPWDGPELTDSPYVILKASLLRYHTALIGFEAMVTAAKLDGMPVIYAVEGAEPDPGIGEEGNLAIDMVSSPWHAWRKTGGVWVAQTDPGFKGDTGDTGASGADGLDGAAATIEIGTVTTLPAGSPATATNSGTPNAAVIDLGIPKGADGDGAGDVVGPVASADGNIALFDGLLGKSIKDSGKALSDFATAAQGAKADSAVQPGDLGSAALEAAEAFAPAAAGVPTGGTTGQVLTKDSGGGAGWADLTGGGGGGEDTLTFYGTLALEQAEDRQTGPVLAGPDGNGIFDGFNVLTYVDVTGATNLDTSKSGVLRPNLSDTTVGQTATPSGTVNIGGVTLVDRGYNLPNNAVVKQIKLYSTATVASILKVVRRNSAGNYDVVYSQSFPHPGGGWATMTLDTFYPVPSTGTYHIAQFYAASQNIQTYTSSGARAAYTGDATGSGLSFNETNGQVYASAAVLAAAGDGMTVASTSFPMTDTPEWARLLVFVELKGAAIGTGLFFDASSDGAVWQEIPMTKLYDRAGGAAVLYGQVALSGVPGLDGRWRVRTSGGSLPEILAIGLMMGRTDA